MGDSPGANAFQSFGDQLRERLPRVHSAYSPSGRVPVLAAFALPGGALVGALVGAAGGLLVLAATGLIVGLIVYLTEAIANTVSVIVRGLIVFGIGIGLLGCLTACIAGGFLISSVIVVAGKWAKNRSTLAAVASGFVSGIGATYLLFAVLQWLTPFIPLQYVPGEVIVDFAQSLNLGGPVSWAVGGVVTASAAALFSWGFTESQRFCETCETFMTSQALAPLGLNELSQALIAAQARDFRAFAHGAADSPAACGYPTLHGCSNCQQGYLDVEVRIGRRHAPADRSNQEPPWEQSWLVMSTCLTQPEFAQLSTALTVGEQSRGE